MPCPKEISKIAIIGTGVIGNGWIARCLAHGMEVVATDPAPGAEEKTREALRLAWPSLEKTGLAVGASPDNLFFEKEISAAVKDADLIQENVPEKLDLKHQVLGEISQHAKPEAIIASSTSGITPSTLQQACRNPEQVLVAHPFNPVYLLPLVELVAGKQTDPQVVKRAEKFYQTISMKPLIVRKEVEGHVADRLMEALWREALHIVNEDIATTEEVDAAIIYGAGLRWAQMGPFLTFHMAGGDAGMRHMLEQFGPALKLPWTKLEAPELTETLKEKVIDGCETHAGGSAVADLAHRRDQFLTEVLSLAQKHWPEPQTIMNENR